jgi:hypothetical protein
MRTDACRGLPRFATSLNRASIKHAHRQGAAAAGEGCMGPDLFPSPSKPTEPQAPSTSLSYTTPSSISEASSTSSHCQAGPFRLPDACALSRMAWPGLGMHSIGAPSWTNQLSRLDCRPVTSDVFRGTLSCSHRCVHLDFLLRTPVEPRVWHAWYR